MLYEIVSTVTEQGIFKGTSGFCPVAITESTPKSLLKPLIDLALRQVKEAETLREKSRNFYSHFPLLMGGKHYHLPQPSKEQ